MAFGNGMNPVANLDLPNESEISSSMKYDFHVPIFILPLTDLELCVINMLTVRTKPLLASSNTVETILV